MGNITLFQQNSPADNWLCRLTQVGLYNGHKTLLLCMVCVVYLYVAVAVATVYSLRTNTSWMLLQQTRSTGVNVHLSSTVFSLMFE